MAMVIVIGMIIERKRLAQVDIQGVVSHQGKPKTLRPDIMLLDVWSALTVKSTKFRAAVKLGLL